MLPSALYAWVSGPWARTAARMDWMPGWSMVPPPFSHGDALARDWSRDVWDGAGHETARRSFGLSAPVACDDGLASIAARSFEARGTDRTKVWIFELLFALLARHGGPRFRDWETVGCTVSHANGRKQGEILGSQAIRWRRMRWRQWRRGPCRGRSGRRDGRDRRMGRTRRGRRRGWGRRGRWRRRLRRGAGAAASAARG